MQMQSSTLQQTTIGAGWMAAMMSRDRCAINRVSNASEKQEQGSRAYRVWSALHFTFDFSGYNIIRHGVQQHHVNSVMWKKENCEKGVNFRRYQAKTFFAMRCTFGDVALECHLATLKTWLSTVRKPPINFISFLVL